SLVTAAGGAILANAMDIDQANRYLGGAYEFMGVAVRVEERERRRDEMARLARALAKGLRDTRAIPVSEAVAALPKELITGANRDRLAVILDRYRRSLYPDTVKIDPAATTRVAEAHRAAGLLAPQVDYKPLLDFSVVAGSLKNVIDLAVGYNHEPVIEKINLEVGAGSFVSLVGPSGSGKTSILRAVSGLLAP